MRFRWFTRRRRRLLFAGAVLATALIPATALADDPDEGDGPPVADLSLALGPLPAVVQGGGDAAFTLTVANAGPHQARRIKVAIALTAATRIDDVQGLGWTCDVGTALATCQRQRLRRSASSTLTVTATARPGLQRLGIGAVVAGRPRDPDPADNTVTGFIAINNPPVVTDDAAATEQNTEIDVPVLDNDFDPDGDQLALSTATQPGSGTAVCADFGCVYTPNPSFRGVDTFTYRVDDGRGGSATATVTVTVDAKPGPPPEQPPVTPPDGSDPGAVVTGPTVVRPGQTGVFNIVLDNGCVITARSVIARVTLPAGSTLVSAPAGATRHGRVVTVRVGDVVRGAPRTLGLRVRFGRRGGPLRTLVVAVLAANARVTGDGVVIAVR